jgi:gamma-glutamyltranspeptidase / glutathione hydrolase
MMRRQTIQTIAAVLSMLAPFADVPHAHAQFAAPEGSSGLAAKPLVTARRQMVVAAHPLAADAGLEILNAGGTAVDAMIATQLVLNLVEPQSSGLGGGAFLLTWTPATGALKSYDGRETAPAAATPSHFMLADGARLPYRDVAFSGRSVGVPGVMHLMETAYKVHGRLPWARLFEPAIKLAEAGFPVSARLHTLLQGAGAIQDQRFAPEARAYFYDANGAPWPVGYLLKNPTFAETLRTLAAQGAGGFYTGPIAAAVVASANAAPGLPSTITLDDLADYKTIEREPVCLPYRSHRICGMGPPSSGALTVGATLALIEPFDLGRAPLLPAALHTIAEAEKLAFADRDFYIGDPGAVTVPAGMLNRAYLNLRRSLIVPDKAMPKATPGEPPGSLPRRAGVDGTIEAAGTSHLSIVDAAGNAVALTTTIEQAFGSHRWAAGFLLNNQLTDFSFNPTDAVGRPIANAVAPGKRPRSSMSPTLIFGPDNRLKAVLGSAGGSRILLHVIKAVVGVIDWQLDAQSAVDLPNFGSRNTGVFELETQIAGDLLGKKMQLFGHQIEPSNSASGLHLIVRRSDGTLEGGADARREGLARGN